MIAALDHLVLTTRHLEKCLDFYTRILGMRLEQFGNGRLALIFGEQKINLHVYGNEFEPKATLPTPGALDLCFLLSMPLAEAVVLLHANAVTVIEGPVERTGARFKLLSVYVRDPDGNLIELAERLV